MSEAADDEKPTAPPIAGPGAAAAPDLQAPALDDNPFRDDAPIDTSSDLENVDLPPAFRSIADQLPPQAKTKLKACDVTLAEVTLSIDDGAEMEPVRMARLVTRNFAEACARKLQRGGCITATIIEPKKHPFTIAFDYELPAAQQPSDVDRFERALQRVVETFNRKLEDVRMEAALNGGGGGRRVDDGLRDEIRALKDAILTRQGGTSQLTELVTALGALNDFSNKAQTSAISSMLQSREQLEKLGVGKVVEKSTAAELREILEIPVVKDVSGAMGQAVVKRMLNPADKTGTPEATGQPGAVDDNPFAESA